MILRIPFREGLLAVVIAPLVVGDSTSVQMNHTLFGHSTLFC
jgi:hypothetical protein